MSGGVPAGWLLVPVEPTPSMMANAAIALGRSGALHGEERQKLLDFWSAMLSAVPAPTPPIEGRDADVERVARALCEYQIRQARRWDTDADVLEAMLPAAITHAWPSFMPQACAALQALGERG